MKLTSIPLILAITLTLSCTQSAEVGELAQNTGPTAMPGVLDLVFVVDNSGSMAEEQVSMAANIQALVDQLEQVPGGLPDIHIGVVSTDLGAGGYAISTCDGIGDDGAFHSAPQTTGCSTPSDSYIANEIMPDGSRSPNYPGTLAETFQCIAQLGTNGCGFEQPLQALRRAIERSQAAGDLFLRPEAYLAVVILGDEDDCSASDTTVFDTSQTDLNSPLGPLTSFRCVEFGLTCDGGDVARTPDTYNTCVPDATSPYLYDTTEFVNYLTALKGNAENVVVSVIAGDRNPLVVTTSPEGNPTTEPTCSSANGIAFGGYRLGAFAEAFPHHLITSLCNPDLTNALSATGSLIKNVMDDGSGTDPNPDPGGNNDAGGCNSTGTTTGAPLVALMLGLLLWRRRNAACPDPR